MKARQRKGRIARGVDIAEDAPAVKNYARKWYENSLRKPRSVVLSMVMTDGMEELRSRNDSCGVRTHALADWRLEPAP